MSNKTIAGLEHEAIDKISAAILNCEHGEPQKQRDILVEAIGIIVEIRILHDRLVHDLERHEE